jgi:hypothetical protein
MIEMERARVPLVSDPGVVAMDMRSLRMARLIPIGAGLWRARGRMIRGCRSRSMLRNISVPDVRCGAALRFRARLGLVLPDRWKRTDENEAENSDEACHGWIGCITYALDG